MLRLITDFDGPIMDVSDRYYCVYQECLDKIKLPQQEVTQLSKAKFWQLKRSQVSERQIGLLSGLNEAQAKDFARCRYNNVHNLPYLVHDKLIPGTLETLEKAQAMDIDLVVMTMRREKALEIALERYNLECFFPRDRRYCLSQDHDKKSDVQDKNWLMTKALQELPPAADVWMIGDTEADLKAAKANQIKAIGVLSGIRDRDRLASHQPDFIVGNLKEAVDLATARIMS